MRLLCVPPSHSRLRNATADRVIILYSQPQAADRGSVGTGIIESFRRRQLSPAPRAWDLASIALAVMAADANVPRDTSPDGWTRQIELMVAVHEKDFWDSQRPLLEQLLRFLTTDVWTLEFLTGGVHPATPSRVVQPIEDCVTLLSGGLDSLIGAIDLSLGAGMHPFAVSQVALGDTEKQSRFASSIAGGLSVLQLNHNAHCPSAAERSQRARSFVFLTYGALVATALRDYAISPPVRLYVCENGLISVNPPFTAARLGSLSTRTTHPIFLAYFRELVNNAGLHIIIEAPYQFKTKGEMLRECIDQTLLRQLAHQSTSCGRYARNNYRHCGRCVPCLIRRAAFQVWNVPDRTSYLASDLSIDDTDHKNFDDVRAAGLAVLSAREQGVANWMGASLLSPHVPDPSSYEATVERGLNELGAFLSHVGVL